MLRTKERHYAVCKLLPTQILKFSQKNQLAHNEYTAYTRQPGKRRTNVLKNHILIIPCETTQFHEEVQTYLKNVV